MSSSKTENNIPPKGYEWEYARKDLNNTKWQNFKLCIYNAEKGEVFGRTPKSWGGIFLFYLIFYSILALLFSLCMYILMATIAKEYPKLQLDESIIGVNPGLGFRPMSPDPEAASLIWYSSKDNSTSQLWIEQTEEFLSPYKTSKPTNQVVCDYGYNPEDFPGKVCEVNVEADLGECTAAFKYGYPQSKPCVFIKLNKIYGWKPVYYKSLDELPHDMPPSLRNYIANSVSVNISHLETVWVSCTGADPHDAENIGVIDYFPLPGFAGYYYPYTNTDGYLSPIIAIRFKNPKHQTLINVECRAWAKNIRYKKSGLNREGSVHFELLVD